MGIRSEEINTLKKAKYLAASVFFTFSDAPFMVMIEI